MLLGNISSFQYTVLQVIISQKLKLSCLEEWGHYWHWKKWISQDWQLNFKLSSIWTKLTKYYKVGKIYKINLSVAWLWLIHSLFCWKVKDSVIYLATLRHSQQKVNGILQGSSAMPYGISFYSMCPSVFWYFCHFHSK